MPLELVGFTNIAKVGMSRPKFETAAFDQPATGARITIVVRKIP